MSCSQKAGVVDVEGAIAAYLQDLHAKGYRPKSVSTYAAALHDLAVHFAGNAIADLREVVAADLDAYALALVERGLAAHTAHIYLRAARLLFGFLEERQLLFESPARGLVIPAPPRHLGHVPSEADVARFLAGPEVATPEGLRDRALVEVAYATGARLGELLGLTTQDPDFARETLVLRGKGGHERVVPLGTQGSRWLREYMDHGRAKLVGPTAGQGLWIGGRGKGLSACAVEWRFRRRCRALSVHPAITPHALRRACATHMLARGAHPAEICALLGHASMRHLCQYLHVTLADVRRMHARSLPGG